jgi:hypothetical protein
LLVVRVDAGCLASDSATGAIPIAARLDGIEVGHRGARRAFGCWSNGFGVARIVDSAHIRAMEIRKPASKLNDHIVRGVAFGFPASCGSSVLLTLSLGL